VTGESDSTTCVVKSAPPYSAASGVEALAAAALVE
jgi:hypothetical protein